MAERAETRPINDFAQYSEHVRFPEGAPDNEVKRWFDQVVEEWRGDPGIYTSSGLDKAIQELREKDWKFKITLIESQVPPNIPATRRRSNSQLEVFDIEVQGSGSQTRQEPYFIKVSRDYLTLSERGKGLIKAFSGTEIIGLLAVPPVNSSRPLF